MAYRDKSSGQEGHSDNRNRLHRQGILHRFLPDPYLDLAVTLRCDVKSLGVAGLACRLKLFKVKSF